MTSVGPDVLVHPTFATPVPEFGQAEILLALVITEIVPIAEVVELCFDWLWNWQRRKKMNVRWVIPPTLASYS